MPGKMIRKFREMRDYTQEYVAIQMGISQNAYSKIENNQTQLTIKHLKQICRILDVPVNELLRDEFELHRPANMMPESVHREHILSALTDLRNKIEVRIPEKHDYFSIVQTLLHTVSSTVNNIH